MKYGVHESQRQGIEARVDQRWGIHSHLAPHRALRGASLSDTCAESRQAEPDRSRRRDWIG